MSNVEEPEGHFNIDEYTDVVMVTKPVIYISVQEICDTHMLLLDHRDEIAPDPNDPLHELLDDLGDAPSVDALIGKTTTTLSRDTLRGKFSLHSPRYHFRFFRFVIFRRQHLESSCSLV